MVWLVAYTYASQQRLAHPHWYVRIVSIRCDIEVIVDIWSNLADKVERILPEAYAHGRQVASEERARSHISGRPMSDVTCWR